MLLLLMGDFEICTVAEALLSIYSQFLTSLLTVFTLWQAAQDASKYSNTAEM